MSTNGNVSAMVASGNRSHEDTELKEIVTSPPQELPESSVDASDNSSGACMEPYPNDKESDDDESPTIKKTQSKTFGTASSFFKKEAETRNRYLKLYVAAFKGDWEAAEDIYRDNEKDISAMITKEGDTALHVAASAKHTDFVEKLVARMKVEDLILRNENGYTAFYLAALTGNVQLVEVILAKNRHLAMIRGRYGLLPLQGAASLGHRDMVTHLYRLTDVDELNDQDRVNLLITFINTEFYDIALDLLVNHPELATARGEKYETALHALARKHSMSSNFKKENQLGILKRCFNLFSGEKNKMHPQAVELVQLIWREVILLDDSAVSELIGKPWDLLFDAAGEGNVEFLTLLINEYPGLILKYDARGWTIFHYAVSRRQEDIFKLIYEIGSFKDFIASLEDIHEDNMLHLAGRLAPMNRLSVVSGVALQVQRELLWFKEVSNVVEPLYAEAKNIYGQAPRMVFTEQHADLMHEGEKWIKETANSCMLVATLITSVVFTATFQVPISNKGHAGVAVLIQKVSFAISLISSATSIITFLCLYTSGYKEDDFLCW